MYGSLRNDANVFIIELKNHRASNPVSKVPFFAAAAVMLSLALLLLPGEVGARGGHRKMSNYHSEYRAAAKPYSGVQLDRKLPFVPLYRYPVKRYLIGKRVQVRSAMCKPRLILTTSTVPH